MTGVSDSIYSNNCLVFISWHADQLLVEFFITVITNGVKIGFNYPQEPF